MRPSFQTKTLPDLELKRGFERNECVKRYGCHKGTKEIKHWCIMSWEQLEESVKVESCFILPSLDGAKKSSLSYTLSLSLPINLFLFTSLYMCVSPTSLSLSFRVNFSLFTPLYLCFSILSFFLSFSSVSCTQHSWWFCVCNSMRVWWDWMLRCLCFHKKEQKMR